MSITPEQLTRLPKYAQDHITRLERDLETARKKVQDGPRDSNATLNPYSQELFTPLGKDVTIQFGDEDGTNFTVKHDGTKNTLDIHTHGEKYGDRLVVLPRSSNAIILTHAHVEL
ncbi:MAG TPA: hypothetical protein VM759_08610 [Longimicrobium sp.]|jgi:hypothetical protein|nr:hypothetical protein [Longimicrobium sp.]